METSENSNIKSCFNLADTKSSETVINDSFLEYMKENTIQEDEKFYTNLENRDITNDYVSNGVKLLELYNIII